MSKGCILPFLKKGEFGITKNCRGIILTAVADNTLLLNCV